MALSCLFLPFFFPCGVLRAAPGLAEAPWILERGLGRCRPRLRLLEPKEQSLLKLLQPKSEMQMYLSIRLYGSLLGSAWEAFLFSEGVFVCFIVVWGLLVVLILFSFFISGLNNAASGTRFLTLCVCGQVAEKSEFMP